MGRDPRSRWEPLRTTNVGGALGGGTVFELDRYGHESILYNFSTFGFLNFGATPSGLIQDSSGDLYFTTVSEAAYPYGTVSKVDSRGNRTVLYAFTGRSDGGQPYGGVVMGAGGSLCGPAYEEGGNSGGLVFKLDPNGKETVLHTFAIGFGE